MKWMVPKVKNPELLAFMQQTLRSVPTETLEPYLSEVREIAENRAFAILAYGSCLSQITKSKTSAPDFFVLTERYSDFHQKLSHGILNRILPPNVYHFGIPTRQGKYNVLSRKDFDRNTSSRAKDLYNLGRLSKRIGIIWTKDTEAEEYVVKKHLEAISTVVSYAYHLVGSKFFLKDLILECLRISYYGDVRVEADDKAQRLFEAEKDYYERVIGEICETMRQHPWCLGYNPTQQRFHKTKNFWLDHFGKMKLRIFLFKSRIRAQLRWPKGIFTVPHWVDYMIAKIERTKGIRLDLSEKEKKYWYIFGWKYFFELKRKNLIK